MLCCIHILWYNYNHIIIYFTLNISVPRSTLSSHNRILFPTTTCCTLYQFWYLLTMRPYFCRYLEVFEGRMSKTNGLQYISSGDQKKLQFHCYTFFFFLLSSCKFSQTTNQFPSFCMFHPRQIEREENNISYTKWPLKHFSVNHQNSLHPLFQETMIYTIFQNLSPEVFGLHVQYSLRI